MTGERLERFDRVLKERTRHVTVVLEDIFQPHNASAVLRSCDAFGIQHIHIIEHQNSFNPNPGITIGADQWLTVHRYDSEDNSTAECIRGLRKQGYSIVATSPHAEDIPIGELPIENPVALMFGTELEGLSDMAREQADFHVNIPMYGFSESFNISVSAALCIYEVTERLRKSSVNWRLPEEEREELRLQWVRQSLRAGDELQEKFLKERSGGHR